MRRSVLDASALLAWLLDERGADVVLAAVCSGTCMTTVNFAEVATRYALCGAGAERIRRLRRQLPFPLVEFDDDLAERVGLLAPLCRRAGLSMGDRACLALAQRLVMPAITADQAWTKISNDLDIEVVSIR